MASGNAVVFDTELDQSGLKSGLSALGGKLNGALKIAGISLSVAALADLAKNAILYNAQMENYLTNFGVMLGDQAKAAEHVAMLKEKAAKTPFGMDDLAKASQTLLSFGVNVENTTKSLDMLGDISLGDKQKMSSLSLAFAQISAAGKLSGQDLLQMVNAGFNPLNTIAERTGTNLGDLKEVMSGGKGSKEFRKQMKEAQKEVKKLGEGASEGAKLLAQIGKDGMISAEMVGKAMEIETSSGGRFYQGMDKASQTVSGLFSTLKDDSAALAGKVFSPVSEGLRTILLPAAIGTVGLVSKVVDGLYDSIQRVFGLNKIEITATAEIEAAQTNLNTLETDLANLRTKFITDVIKVNLDSEEAKQKLQELKDLKLIDKEMLTEAEKARMVELTNALVEMIPALSKYVGSDGVLRTEKKAVDELVTSYKELAIKKYAAEYKANVQARYDEASFQYGILQQKEKELQKDKKIAEEQAAAWKEVKEESSSAAMGIHVGAETDTESLQAGLDVLQKYVDMGGSLKDLEGMNIDLSGLLGLNSKTLDVGTVQQDADAIFNLSEALDAISRVSHENEANEKNKITALSEAIATASAAIKEHIPTLQAAVAAINETDAVIASIEDGTFFTNAEAAATEGGQKVTKAFHAGLDSADGEGEDVDGPFSKAVAKDADKAISSVQAKAAAVKAAIKASMGLTGDMEAGGEGAASGEGEGEEGNAMALLGAKMMEALAAAIAANESPKNAVRATLTNARMEGNAFVTQFSALGQQLAAGVAAGIKAGTSAVCAAVRQMIQEALAAGEAAAEINSPSHLFRDIIGMSLAEGTAAGVDRGSHLVDESVGRMIYGSLEGIGDVSQRIANGAIAGSGMVASAAMSAPKVIVVEKAVEQHIQFNQPVQTPDEFANMLQLYRTYGLAGGEA